MSTSPETSVSNGKATTQSADRFNIISETDPLRHVLVHTPGREMELVSPDNREELLFDDILFLGHARKEHELMCRLFQKVVARPETVSQVGTMLREAFDQEAARLDFIERLCRTLPQHNLRAVEKELLQFNPEALFRFALTGESSLPVTMQPLPNLIFTRDLASVVGDCIILSHAAMAARSRESIIISVVLHHHPDFADVQDRIITLPEGVTFEGGDLLVPSPKVVLIGHSERTSFGATMAIAHELFNRTRVEDVLVVDLPKRRSCMHLDTVITFASPQECVAFPPLLDKSSFGYAVHVRESDTPGKFITDMRPDFRRALEDVLDRSLTFIPCGGNQLLDQQREQWTDGANLFAIAPGVVVGYERNRKTFDELDKHGYRVVSARGFLNYHKESGFQLGEKIAIKLGGTELSRGRGGPRCMTLPLARQPVESSDGTA